MEELRKEAEELGVKLHAAMLTMEYLASHLNIHKNHFRLMYEGFITESRLELAKLKAAANNDGRT